ncbi:MAG: F0F1 ATP synthase subunit B [Rhodospirillales bacterium]|nr:F0F1 ATP synthase subunit B [Rhodospirillales bacterium]
MFSNPTFWVGVGFVLFVVLAWKPLSKAILGTLDERAAKIKAQIEEAERLRAEAQTILAEYKAKHARALQEAQAIVAAAQDEAKRIAAEASVSLDAALKRREQQALDKIAQAEAAALRDVRNQAVDIAMAAARQIVAGQVQGPRGADLIEAAIKELPAKLH